MSKSLEHKEAKELFRVISDPPKWIHRYGIITVAIFVTIIGILASVIRYPDDIQAPIVLLSDAPAIRVFSKNRGELDQLYVQEGQMVQKGEPLGLIRSSANYDHINALDSILSLNNTEENIYNYLLSLQPELGAVQQNFANYFNRLNTKLSFQNLDNYPERIALLKRQISDTKAMENTLSEQQRILNEQVQLAQKDYDRNEKLFKEQVISEIALEQIKKELLRQKNQSELVTSTLIQNRLNGSQISQQLVQLETEYKTLLNEQNFLLQQSKNLLISSIEQWKLLNIINAPVSGRVNLTNIDTENEFLRENIEVMVIEPDGKTGEIWGKVILAGMGVGKVKEGMKVFIQLDNYPYYEFGGLQGKVTNISSVTNGQGYEVAIALTGGLVTTYKRELDFRHEMTGMVSIVTEDRTILARVFDRFLSLMKNNAER